MRQSWALPALLWAALLCTCSVDISGAPCRTDDNCPADQFCGNDGTCQAGTREPGADSGVHPDADGGPHPGFDGGGADGAGGDTGHIDAAVDGGHDGGTDAGDAGADGGADAGVDGGAHECDKNNPCPFGVCCDYTCVAGECCEHKDCKIPGRPQCSVDHMCNDRCPAALDCGKGYVCCNEVCRSGDCCDGPDCVSNPNGQSCINYNCSTKCLTDVDCGPGRCCTKGPAAGSCYGGTCCDDSDCTPPEKCSGGVSGTCGCTPESPIEFCKSMSSVCGETTGKDNCQKDRTENCGSCTACKNFCDSGECVAARHAAAKCDAGDVWWFDSCGVKEEMEQDCGATQVCTGNACCTPSDKTAACAGKCGAVGDGCQGTHDCGSCANGYACDPNAHSCKCASGKTCDVSCCPNASDACFNNACCAPKSKTAACTGVECGIVSDGCGGTYDCGGCVSPKTCSNNHCVSCAVQCGGKCGGPDGCGGTCPDTCVLPNTCGGGGAQYACGCAPKDKTTVCTGHCGMITDGCTGTYDCGGCTNGFGCDGGNHTCQCASAKVCNGQCCGSISDVCYNNACCTRTPQATACNGKCGPVSDGCGGTYDCGGCSNGYACTSHTCQCASAKVCSGQCCGSASDVCYNNTCCTKADQNAACSGKCGTVSDGCGGTYTCPGCANGFTCSGNACVCVSGKECNNGQVCCASGSQVCDLNQQCCSPVAQGVACSGKCGMVPDNCGGEYDCGGCPNDWTCSGNQCVCPSNKICLGQCCGESWHVCRTPEGTCCAPIDKATQCANRQCGPVDDGCGGQYDCGACQVSGDQCDTNGKCVCPSGVVCAGVCCASAAEICDVIPSSGKCCTPDNESTICMNNNWECGSHNGVIDNCGITRSVSCGNCTQYGVGYRCCNTSGQGYCYDMMGGAECL